jgi:hypothetical protein
VEFLEQVVVEVVLSIILLLLVHLQVVLVVQEL